MICTGDVAAYCADPQACADRLRGEGIAVVMGNCEESLGADAADCGCGFAEGSACERLSLDWFAYCRAALDASAKSWMAALPRRLELGLAGRRLAVIHGGASAINHFIFASAPAREKRRELELAGAEGVIAGHCGLPFSELVGTKLWHNAGTIGMPANDGTPRVWFSLLEADAGGIRVSHHALAYDHATAARKMRERGLPEGYAACLLDGLWPSCDILPPRERAARGAPLAPRSLLWPSCRRAAALDKPAARPNMAR